jgi:L-aminopeptidase/D-esterase-like protein
MELPAGFEVGHWTNLDGPTGCTVILAPAGAIAGGEVRGGGPATRDSDLMRPSTNAPGVQAVCFAGRSAYGLGAAEGVVPWLEERGIGYETPSGLVPLVSGAGLYDLALGDTSVRPGPEAGRAACEAATATPERGTVGAGTGATAGKLHGPGGWTKSGVGLASERVMGAVVAALAVANPVGEIVAEDGSVLAGVWSDGGYVRSTDLIKEGAALPATAREATTLVCVMTDARLGKREAWLVARAATSGVGRAIQPSATAWDGDLVYCLATGEVDAHPFAVSAIAADVTAAAIRDAARSATSVPGATAAADR